MNPRNTLTQITTSTSLWTRKRKMNCGYVTLFAFTIKTQKLSNQNEVKQPVCAVFYIMLHKSFFLKVLLKIIIYKMLHPPFCFLALTGGAMTALMASSKTFFNPFWVKAEHSRYLTALICLALAIPLHFKLENQV